MSHGQTYSQFARSQSVRAGGSAATDRDVLHFPDYTRRLHTLLHCGRGRCEGGSGKASVATPHHLTRSAIDTLIRWSLNVLSKRRALQGFPLATESSNRSLGNAQKAKEDEFYTQLSDIERELKHYRKHFAGKVVYCNCDDPRVSNFFHFFSYSFERLGLKRLVATCYKSQTADLFSQNDSEQAVYLEYEGDKNQNMVPDPTEIGMKLLKGDGDFRSEESIELLKQADVVVTNPPFSLFREYVAQLMEYDKKFIIIGSVNAVTYNDIFKLIRTGKLWLGNGFQAGNAYFAVPSAGNYAKGVYDENSGLVKFRNVTWFTNLDISKRHEKLILYKTYNPEQYPTYDNYDAIEVAKVADIPMDYDGVMGVPLTFLEKHNPDQFEILGLSGGDDFPMTKTYGKKVRVVDGVPMKSNTGTLRAVIRTESFGSGTHFDVGYPIKGVYRRLFIRRKGAVS